MTLKPLISGALLLLSALAAPAAVTLERCLELATENYPLIKKYGLLDRTQELSLSDINKTWLPQVGVYGQATIQNVVAEFPEALTNILSQMGQDVQGLDKLQYRVGLELNQNIWDGGAASARREIARGETAERRARLDVELYALRQRVESVFFGILLIEEQIKQTHAAEALLQANLDRLTAMHDNGTALRSDVDMVHAQLLATTQQLTHAQAAADSYRRMLELYIGQPLGSEALQKPAAQMPAELTSARPELALFDAQTRANSSRLSAVKSSLMPRIGLFAQGFYGYPGFDNFRSMMTRDWTLNVMAGVKVSWTLGGLYNKGNRERELQLASEGVAADRELFFFNSRLQSAEQNGRIRELEELRRQDAQILELRSRVRQAAESQMRNGVIDATALLQKITDENQARLAASYHEIQLIQTIYELKHTLNR